MLDVATEKAIRSAIEAGDARTALEHIGSDPERLHAMTMFGTWLHVAAAEGQLDIVKALLDRGLDINAYGGISGGGALHYAASYGRSEIAKYLIERGANLDVSEPVRNPLFGAIYRGHTVVAKLLIESGIDTSVKYTGENMQNMDALAFAREWGRSDIAALLQAKAE